MLPFKCYRLNNMKLKLTKETIGCDPVHEAPCKVVKYTKCGCKFGCRQEISSMDFAQEDN